MGGVFVVEVSVMRQVTYFKSSGVGASSAWPRCTTSSCPAGKRTRSRAFWIITMMLVLVGLSTLENSMRTLRIR